MRGAFLACLGNSLNHTTTFNTTPNMGYQLNLNQSLGQALFSARGWAGVDVCGSGLTIRVGHTMVATRPDSRETTFWNVSDVPMALETIAKAVEAQAAADRAAKEWHRSAPRAERMIGTLRTHS